MCGVNARNDLRCWDYRIEEYEENGQPTNDILYVDATLDRPCALRTDSTLDCWSVEYTEPISDAPSEPVRQYSLSIYGFGCSLDMNGNLSCWGDYSDVTDAHPEGQFSMVEVGTVHVRWVLITRCNVGEITTMIKQMFQKVCIVKYSWVCTPLVLWIWMEKYTAGDAMMKMNWSIQKEYMSNSLKGTVGIGNKNSVLWIWMEMLTVGEILRVKFQQPHALPMLVSRIVESVG